MADELQDGSEVVDFQEDYFTEDELFNKTNTNCMQSWKYFGFQLDNKGNPCSNN